ncbi:MAG: ABC transporter ATP-binding protein [Lentisphaeria bacterium]|nr:ABC transporter ATP-binding protein [Lentisphaeria bacterium]
MSSEVIVSAQGLCKYYRIYRQPYHRLLQCLSGGRFRLFREVQAVRGCSFEVRRGECLGIIGRNGAGKSTVLQLLAGTISPTSGTLSIRGRIAALLELGSGFNPEFTGRENIFMYGAILGLSPEKIRERCQSIIDFSGIGDAVDQPVKTYSSGMAMRLAFSVVAHIDADILIIDEALAVGDVVFVQKCYAFLREFIRDHTVILVTHDVAAVRDLCDRVIWLNEGRVMESGLPAKVTDDYLAFCYEERQGASRIEPAAAPEAEEKVSSDVRGEIWKDHPEAVPKYAFFAFDENAPSFGRGGARIRDISLSDREGRRLDECLGGEQVRLVLRIDVLEEMKSPIVGFAFRNSRGENIFGDNSFELYRDRPCAMAPGEVLEAVFEFEMPRLHPGEYTLHAAVADGTQDEHVQHQWFHNALTIRSFYNGKTGVMVGIPMRRIELRKVPGDPDPLQDS